MKGTISLSWKDFHNMLVTLFAKEHLRIWKNCFVANTSCIPPIILIQNML